MFGKSLEVIQFQICFRRTIDKLGHKVGWVEKIVKPELVQAQLKKLEIKHFHFTIRFKLDQTFNQKMPE